MPKIANTRNIAEHRPIAKLVVPNKIFEKVIFDKLYPQVHKHIAHQQHGFTKHRSIQTNLLEFTQYVTKILDASPPTQVDVIYTDFQKAFDKVDHQILLWKLCAISFSEPLLNLFRSYLSQQKQYVNYKNTKSHTYNCTSGVTQGATFGSFLFTIYDDDIPTNLHNSCLLYTSPSPRDRTRSRMPSSA